MDERTDALKVRRGISWDPEDDQIAQELAAKKDGGNVSLLLRRLLRTEWERRRKMSESRKAKAVA